MPKTAFNLGDRVGVNDYIGTIKYKGAVDGTKGEYYGVEWDQISRGKHNGTHQGKTYFTTSGGLDSGSFIRGKLIKPALTCVEAVYDRYGKVEDDSAGIDESEAYLSQGDGGRVINIQVVGMDKVSDLQSQYDKLKTVDIKEMCVHGETDSLALGRLIPRVEELDLSYNLITSWSELANITKHLDNLRFLYLNGNRLTFSLEKLEEDKPAFQRIRKWRLNQTNLTWGELLEASQLWPGIEELHFCLNGISELSSVPDWQNLQLLNLGSNPLKTWSNIRHLSKLPKLKELYLRECELCDIVIEDGDFPSLKYLDLNKNNIGEWKHLAELNKLSELTDLIFLRNPLLENADLETVRQLIIAKILHLKKHNRTVIEANERRGAEIDYSKRFGEQWISSGASMEPTDANRQFCAEHPTYFTIIKKWGAPEKTEVKQWNPMSAIKGSLIELTFVDLVTESGKQVVKRIPHTMTVSKCRNLAIKLLGIKGIPSVITYRAHQNGEEYDFDYDLRQITFYGVQHGDEILLRQIP